MFKKSNCRMKKIYQNPEMKIVKVQPSQMIAESVGFGDNVTTASGAESRRHGGSLWDDGDED